MSEAAAGDVLPNSRGVRRHRSGCGGVAGGAAELTGTPGCSGCVRVPAAANGGAAGWVQSRPLLSPGDGEALPELVKITRALGNGQESPDANGEPYRSAGGRGRARFLLVI